jgi:hypothetical protein
MTITCKPYAYDNVFHSRLVQQKQHPYDTEVLAQQAEIIIRNVPSTESPSEDLPVPPPPNVVMEVLQELPVGSSPSASDPFLPIAAFPWQPAAAAVLLIAHATVVNPTSSETTNSHPNASLRVVSSKADSLLVSLFLGVVIFFWMHGLQHTITPAVEISEYGGHYSQP